MYCGPNTCICRYIMHIKQCTNQCNAEKDSPPQTLYMYICMRCLTRVSIFCYCCTGRTGSESGLLCFNGPWYNPSPRGCFPPVYHWMDVILHIHQDDNNRFLHLEENVSNTYRGCLSTFTIEMLQTDKFYGF